MAKILSFRNKDGGTAGQDFLTDETETLSFRTAEDGAVSLGEMSQKIMSGPLPDPRKDWSNQELADLFRVRQLLGGAGVPVDTMRGITDEGDPWFVYCHLNGDVFIHMARIDGLYVLDSPNVHRPLRGRDFNELIADFTSDALPTFARADDDGSSERRVIKLERGGKVRLHPSAMLAALIWTLFLASEELVMLAPEEQALAEDDLLDFSDMIFADTAHQPLDMETADLDQLFASDSLRASHDDDAITTTAAAPDGQMQIRDIMVQQGLTLHQNAFAMGLSTIAIAMGFMSEVVLMDNQRKVLEGLKSLGFTQDAIQTEAGPQLAEITGEGDNTLLDMLAEFLGLDLSLDTEFAEAPAPQQGDAVLMDDDVQLLAEAMEETTVVTPKPVQTVTRKNLDDAELNDAPVKTSAAEVSYQESLIAMALAEQDDDSITMSDLLGNSQQKMEEFQLGQTKIMASFDVTKSDAFSLSEYLFFTQRTTDHRNFDSRAQSFIDFIQAKETDVGVITFGNEIIMIDRGAFKHDGAETYAFSWETSDGQVISMIGLKAEFQQFDLIA